MAPRLRTRNGRDCGRRFPAIAAAAGALKVRSAVIDGEAVILDDRGRFSFAELQADLDRRGSAGPAGGIAYRSVTTSGELRHASFKGLVDSAL